MEDTIVFSTYVQGASHKPDKPCQDFAGHVETDDYAIVALSDGHGGKKYFRSQYGSKIAVEVAISTLEVICKELDFANLLGEKNLIQVPISAEANEVDKEIEYVMRHVFQHICSEWHRRIEEHMKDNPLTDEEERFLRSETDQGKPLYGFYFDENNQYRRRNISSAYGCTLFGVAETKDGYWVGFQIGDGKCVAFWEGETHEMVLEDETWNEPLLWDKRCFQNMTTSLSHYGEESFRYSIGRKAPSAIFIASDGMDDSFDPMPELAFEYATTILANIAFNGPDATSDKLNNWLDKVSASYSKDDMSIGYIIRRSNIHTLLERFINFKLEVLHPKLTTVRDNAQQENDSLQKALRDLEEIEIKLKSKEESIQPLMTQGLEFQEKYDDLEKKLSKKEQAHSKFFKRFKASLSQRWSRFRTDAYCEVERDFKEIAIKLKDIQTEIEQNDNSIQELKETETKLALNIPVLKKHAREAADALKNIEYKIQRLERVKQFLNKD